MKLNDTALSHSPWLSHPDIAFSALLERRAPVRGGSSLSALPIKAAVASSADALAAASDLVECRYAWRGYSLKQSPGAAAVTLVATQASATVGTLTLRVDDTAGLAADEVYRDAIDHVRAAGRRVCELTRLAIDVNAAWRPTLGALIGLAYGVARALHDVTDVFVEVNPRHERFYQRMFGFVTAANARVCPRVEAPAVLLRLEIERLEAGIAQLGWLPRARVPASSSLLA